MEGVRESDLKTTLQKNARIHTTLDRSQRGCLNYISTRGLKDTWSSA